MDEVRGPEHLPATVVETGLEMRLLVIAPMPPPRGVVIGEEDIMDVDDDAWLQLRQDLVVEEIDIIAGLEAMRRVDEQDVILAQAQECIEEDMLDLDAQMREAPEPFETDSGFWVDSRPATGSLVHRHRESGSESGHS